MYRKDLITTEIQKLAQVLARIIGLKLEGKQEESDQLFEQSLQADFGLLYSELLEYNHADFESYLKTQDFASEKLELLSKFLYFKMESFKRTEENKDVAERLLQLYDFIENEHHTQSFEGLSRQKQIKGFLENI